MIVVQILLIIVVLSIMLYFLGKNNNKISALKKIFMLIILLAGITFIIAPQLANNVANFIGIGRGADLIFYAFVLALIFQTINNSIRRKEDRKREAKIVRKIALLDRKLTDIDQELKK
jgi:hypothetical protein